MVEKKGYELKDGCLIINRDLTILDFFVKDFLKVLTKYSDYLVVSGFVSISTGRTRGTEDVDLLMPFLPYDVFEKLFLDLIKHNFWCYQSDTASGAYDYIKNMESLRFAKAGQVFPNMEVIPITPQRKAKYFEFSNPQKIKVGEFEFKIPPLEFEILYKEIILGSDKDLADARHLRTFFSSILSEDKFKEYAPIIRADKK